MLPAAHYSPTCTSLSRDYRTVSHSPAHSYSRYLFCIIRMTLNFLIFAWSKPRSSNYLSFFFSPLQTHFSHASEPWSWHSFSEEYSLRGCWLNTVTSLRGAQRTRTFLLLGSREPGRSAKWRVWRTFFLLLFSSTSLKPCFLEKGGSEDRHSFI